MRQLLQIATTLLQISTFLLQNATFIKNATVHSKTLKRAASNSTISNSYQIVHHQKSARLNCVTLKLSGLSNIKY